MSQVNEAMQTLTAQWYNTMVTGLGLSDQQFQLYQGPNSLVTTSQDMWNMFNAVPPKAVNSNYLDPSQSNSFAPDYNLILTALVASSDSDFRNCMGDYYGQWADYFAKNPLSTVDAKSVSGLFQKWAIMNAPGKAGCITALTKIFIDPINVANNMFGSANGSYPWNNDVDALTSALAGGGSKSFTMNSNIQSSDVKHTWAGGTTSMFFNIFSLGGSASYDSLSTKATSAGINITANFEKVTTFAAGPYAQADPNNPILSKYAPWYSSAVMAKAYTNKNNTVWNKESAINWETAFGANGFLQRMTTALVAADGITITMSSTASYNSLEQTQIQAAAKGGFWPFFSGSGGSGSNTTVTFGDSGAFTSKTTIGLGNPQCLGILQTPISNLFQ